MYLKFSFELNIKCRDYPSVYFLLREAVRFHMVPPTGGMVISMEYGCPCIGIFWAFTGFGSTCPLPPYSGLSELKTS